MQATRRNFGLGRRGQRRTSLLATLSVALVSALLISRNGAADDGRRPASSARHSGPAKPSTALSANLTRPAVAASTNEPTRNARLIETTRELGRRPESAERDGQLRELFAQLAATDVAAAFALAKDLMGTSSESSRTDIYAAILDTVVASNNPLRALSLVRLVPDPEIHWNLSQRIVLAWAESEPRAAKEWIDALPTGFGRDILLLELGQQKTAADPTRAITVLGEISDPNSRRAALTDTLLNWFQADPGGSTRWLAEVPPHADLDHVAAAIASLPTLVPARADIALGWAESIVDQRMREATIARILQAWSQTDAVAAANYVQAFPQKSGSAEQGGRR